MKHARRHVIWRTAQSLYPMCVSQVSLPVALSAASIAPKKFNKMVDNCRRARILNLMVEYDSPRLDSVFHALGDPTRRGMLANLALGEKSIGELAQPFEMSFAGASKHVKVLEDAGLVARRKSGRMHICSLKAEPLAEANRWLRQWEQFWTTRLDRLQALIESETKAKEKPHG